MRSRPLAILICVIVLVASFFVVSGSAAGTENLIESDLTQWSNIEDSFVVSAVKKGDLFRLSSNTSSSDYFLGIVYDLPSFIAGHSYTLKFRLPSASEISSVWGITYTNDNISHHYNNSTVLVGYGFLDPSGTKLEIQNNLFEFNSSNILKYVGTDLTTSFVAGSSSGRPVIFILLSNSDGSVHHYFFSDFVMYDNDDNSGQIKGILGILHSLRWDIFGGVCDSDDCSHSSDFNPHISLTERFTVGFTNLFNVIASKFEEGSTLNTWFIGLSDGVSNLGTNVNNWLLGHASSINSKLSDVITDITSGLTDLGVDIGGFIDGAVEIIDGLFQTFFDFIETFKPRVSERFKWRPGDINSSTGEVILKDEGYYYAIVTDLFTVEPGTKVYLDFEPDSSVTGISVFQYDFYGNYVCEKLVSTGSLEEYELPSGYSYRFRVNCPTSEFQLSHINQFVHVYTDEGWIMSFIHVIEDFGTGCINMVLYFDWYGDYENPFVSELPFVSFIRSALFNLTEFINGAVENYLEVRVKGYAFNILFSYILEEVPYLMIIGLASLFLVVVSRFIGI